MKGFERMTQVEKDVNGKIIVKIFDKTGTYKIRFNYLDCAIMAAKEWIREVPIEDILFIHQNEPKLRFDSPIVYSEAFAHFRFAIE